MISPTSHLIRANLILIYRFYSTMSPLRAESSTVSLAPRERRAAKRRAKAIRQGQPISHTSTNGVKKLAKAPAPTLATTRKRRAAALNIAYIDRPDGYHIKQVVRRLATPDHAPPIPYLRGQEGELVSRKYIWIC